MALAFSLGSIWSHSSQATSIVPSPNWSSWSEVNLIFCWIFLRSFINWMMDVLYFDVIPQHNGSDGTDRFGCMAREGNVRTWNKSSQCRSWWWRRCISKEKIRILRWMCKGTYYSSCFFHKIYEKSLYFCYFLRWKIVFISNYCKSLDQHQVLLIVFKVVNVLHLHFSQPRL